MECRGAQMSREHRAYAPSIGSAVHAFFKFVAFLALAMTSASERSTALMRAASSAERLGCAVGGSAGFDAGVGAGAAVAVAGSAAAGAATDSALPIPRLSNYYRCPRAWLR